MLILAVTAVIVVEAVVRLGHSEPVRGGVMLVVALAATALNVGAALVGVAAAGAVILATGRLDWLDPAVSIMIGAVVAAEAWRLVRAAVEVLLESTPSDIDLDDLGAAMAGIDRAAGVHDVHVWSVSSGLRGPCPPTSPSPVRPAWPMPRRSVTG